MMQRRTALGLALAAGLAPNVARAQAWRPTRPVRLVVPFAPGGSNDIVGRIIAEAAGGILGQPVVVENRAGAGSVIGAEHAARSPADGYTVLINSAHASVPALVARVPSVPELPRGAHVVLGIEGIDLLEAELRLRYIELAPELAAELASNDGSDGDFADDGDGELTA